MRFTVERFEGRAARWANIFAVIPGSYCAYVLWAQRNGEISMTVSRAFVFSVAAFFVCILIGAILNFVRRDNKQVETEGPSNTVVPSSEIEKLQQLHHDELRRIEISHKAELWRANECRNQCEAERREAMDKVSSLETQLALFSPLQLEAFRLARQLREFLKSLGPRPDVDWTGASTSSQIAERLSERRKLQLPWTNRMVTGFLLKFSNDIKKMTFHFGQAGVDQPDKLLDYIGDNITEKAIEEAAQTLQSLAIRVDYQKPEEANRDTRRKVDQITADDFKKLIENPEFALWIGIQIGEGK
jgi:hypothetical protein